MRSIPPPSFSLHPYPTHPPPPPKPPPPLQVMPVHATRMIPGTERITSDIRSLVNAFDPAKPVCYSLEFDALPKVNWMRNYRDIEVTVHETGGVGG